MHLIRDGTLPNQQQPRLLLSTYWGCGLACCEDFSQRLQPEPDANVHERSIHHVPSSSRPQERLAHMYVYVCVRGLQQGKRIINDSCERQRRLCYFEVVGLWNIHIHSSIFIHPIHLKKFQTKDPQDQKSFCSRQREYQPSGVVVRFEAT
jgi:hypothetical protein